MTSGKMGAIEDKIYEAVRAKWGYGAEGDEIVDGLMEAFDAWYNREEGAELRIKIKDKE